jgi:hypothetical protein
VDRRWAVAVAVVTAVSVQAGSPAAAADDAATVNDESVTVEEFGQFATALADAGLDQFAATAASRTLDAEAGRSLLTVLVMNEARGQFLASRGEEPPTDAEIEEVYAGLGADHPLQALTGDARVAVASDSVYAQRLDAIAVPDVEALRSQYEESPASLGVYCATAVNVASEADAETVLALIDDGAAVDDAAATVDDASVSDWQCTPLSTVADPVLLADLAEAAPGEAIGPVRTGDGLAVLVVDDFETAAPKLENFFLRLEDGGETSVGFVLFQGFLLGADITVNPRYGRWDTTSGSIVPLGA